jgi:sulfoxide reductase catalytic subunit YedY
LFQAAAKPPASLDIPHAWRWFTKEKSMLIRRLRGWEISENRVTPEALMLGRRAALGGTAAAVAASIAAPAQAQWLNLLGGGGPATPAKPLAALTAPNNAKFTAGRALTEERDATSYNNFYEFGTSKSIVGAAQALPTEPWTVEITGMVAKPKKWAVEDLLKQVQLEERIYRHRCVETWAMTVPWTGFPLSKLVDLAEPMAGAKYVTFTTLADKKTMPGLGMRFYPWPYLEGVTMDEARNDLAFMAVGMYGKTLPPQNGAPLRLALPWKYGFKSAKSIVKIEFTDKRPVVFWEALQDSEYGFWANVNPEVPHPRWSQASETLLGHDERVPTRIFNGYGEYVAAMYNGMTKEKLFM